MATITPKIVKGMNALTNYFTISPSSAEKSQQTKSSLITPDKSNLISHLNIASISPIDATDAVVDYSNSNHHKNIRFAAESDCTNIHAGFSWCRYLKAKY